MIGYRLLRVLTLLQFGAIALSLLTHTWQTLPLDWAILLSAAAILMGAFVWIAWLQQSLEKLSQFDRISAVVALSLGSIAGVWL